VLFLEFVYGLNATWREVIVWLFRDHTVERGSKGRVRVTVMMSLYVGSMVYTREVLKVILMEASSLITCFKGFNVVSLTSLAPFRVRFWQENHKDALPCPVHAYLTIKELQLLRRPSNFQILNCIAEVRTR
jgi:hypothetical protein